MKNLAKTAAAAVALSGAFVSVPTSAATVIGDTIECRQTSANSNFNCAPNTAEVGAGLEFTGGNATRFLTFDFDRNSLVINSIRTNGLGSTAFEFINLDRNFQAASITNQLGFFGFNQSDVSVNNGVLGLNFAQTFQPRGSSITLEFAVVPEPAIWAMMIFGFFGIGHAMRRSRATKRDTTVA